MRSKNGTHKSWWGLQNSNFAKLRTRLMRIMQHESDMAASAWRSLTPSNNLVLWRHKSEEIFEHKYFCRNAQLLCMPGSKKWQFSPSWRRLGASVDSDQSWRDSYKKLQSSGTQGNSETFNSRQILIKLDLCIQCTIGQGPFKYFR